MEQQVLNAGLSEHGWRQAIKKDIVFFLI